MDIDTTTDGFNQRRIMAKDATGTSYAGVLQNGDLATVKRIHPLLVLRNAGLSGFSSVMKSLFSAQHPNIVSIIGFSEAPGERIIVMEFVDTLTKKRYYNDLFVFDLDQFKIFLHGGYSKEVLTDKNASEKGIVHSDMWSLDPKTWEWNKFGESSHCVKL